MRRRPLYPFTVGITCTGADHDAVPATGLAQLWLLRGGATLPPRADLRRGVVLPVTLKQRPAVQDEIADRLRDPEPAVDVVDGGRADGL